MLAPVFHLSTIKLNQYSQIYIWIEKESGSYPFRMLFCSLSARNCQVFVVFNLKDNHKAIKNHYDSY